MAPNNCSCSSRSTNTELQEFLKSQGFYFPNPDTEPVTIAIDARRKRFESWVAKQCLPIQAAVDMVNGAVAGAIMGVFLDIMFDRGCSALSFQLTPSQGYQFDQQKLSRLGGYQPLIRSIVAGPTLEQARNFAAMHAINSGVSCVMKKLTNKDDVRTSMVAAFGSGVMLSLVTGMRGPNVVSVGVMFALVRGVHFTVKEKLSQPQAEDALPGKTRAPFSCIGLGVDHYAMGNGLQYMRVRKET